MPLAFVHPSAGEQPYNHASYAKIPGLDIAILSIYHPGLASELAEER
ncbi:MAG: Uncharacterised protein [Methanobacteriota archaeon]|nr:MAG: Uncharacterised protein [Euryarchaeota archaeon]